MAQPHNRSRGSDWMAMAPVGYRTRAGWCSKSHVARDHWHHRSPRPNAADAARRPSGYENLKTPSDQL